MPTLDDINYLKISPEPPLGDYVQTIWLARHDKNKEVLAFSLLSDCGSCILFNYGDEIRLTRNNHSHRVSKQAAVVGPSKALFEIVFNNQICTLGINFHPGTGCPFLESGMEQLIDRIDISNEKRFANAHHMYIKFETEIKAVTGESLLRKVEEGLISNLSNYHLQAQDKLESLITLFKREQDMPLELLADMSGVSAREIQRKFKQYVGISPKVYQRLMKLNKVKGRLSSGDYESLTQLAIDNGYYDQAHFIREFKYFMKLTPKQYRKLKENN
ncbi:helix-turn-helix domain-containing protein [Marinomonas sp. PE14-40]|uniref:helix-turn-helix domain-containing protein n=1 Tax=Marinomonas sp. PE14-40 TaxID=3060621 RepID=UPI003F681737